MHIQLSGNSTGMPMPKNTILFLSVLIITAIFTSCKKEAVPAKEQQAMQQQSTDAAVRASTNFGALLSGNTKIDEEIKVLQKLGVNYVRYAIFLKTFNGEDKGIAFTTDELKSGEMYFAVSLWKQD